MSVLTSRDQMPLGRTTLLYPWISSLQSLSRTPLWPMRCYNREKRMLGIELKEGFTMDEQSFGNVLNPTWIRILGLTSRGHPNSFRKKIDDPLVPKRNNFYLLLRIILFLFICEKHLCYVTSCSKIHSST